MKQTVPVGFSQEGELIHPRKITQYQYAIFSQHGREHTAVDRNGHEGGGSEGEGGAALEAGGRVL